MSNQSTMPARPIPTELPSTARLFVFPPAGASTVVDLKGPLTIGRAESNLLALADSRASGAHARIRKRQDSRKWTLEDRESTNGTFVNGKRIEARPLEHGDVIRIGDTLLVYENGARPKQDVSLQSIEALRLERQLERVTSTEAPVLILGATGAGKGHLARRIADGSNRKGRYVHVNCAALPAALVEAELFGHAKGAFTGATGVKPGLIEEADGGTLFLDEIGTLAPELQAKLLVALEEGTVRRIGSTEDKRVDVRFLAATNADVHNAIAERTFREDLYYRLAAHTVTVPDLKTRRPDILPIFLHATGLDDHRSLSPELIEALLLWAWPGNIRELLNVARTLGGADPEAAHDYDALPEPMIVFLRSRSLDDSSAAASASRSRAIPNKAELARTLEECAGNVSELARRLGKHRNQVVRWLDAYGLRSR